MTDLDRETSAAVEALAHRIRNRDAAILGGSDCEEIGDSEVFAREFLTALRGRGWRPTEARVLPSWKPGQPGSGKPPAGLLEELRADLAAKADHAKTDRQDGDETGTAA